MREEYDTSGSGKFEGCPPIAQYIYDNAEEDEATGNSFDYVWTGRFGKRILQEDEFGFVYYLKTTLPDAKRLFVLAEDQYQQFLSIEEDD